MKIRSKVTIGLLASAMCVVALAHAGYKRPKGSPDSIEFKTKAIAGAMTINGTVPGFEFAEEVNGVLVFKANLHDLKTGMAERDTHAVQVLGVKKSEKHKYAKLEVPVASVATGKGKTGKGTFTLGGKPAPLTFKYDAVKKDNGTIAVEAKFTVKLTDHGIEPPCKLGVCVKDTTDVTVKFILKPS